MNPFIEKIKSSAKEYGSIPFWSWNDRLEPEELVRQIRNMDDMEMRGFFMHARGGLETEYMSDAWYDCIKACIDEAKKRGMEAWAYDENGWPSGFAGGKLLEDPDNHAVFIEGEIFDAFPAANAHTLAIYSMDGNHPPKITDRAVDGCTKYLMVSKGTDSSYVDTMRGDITDQFLKTTHEDYKNRLGDAFGTEYMPGFFTDEPQYYRWKTPFSNKMDQWFREEYGYSVLDALPSLFCDYDGAEKYRYDYHRMTAAKFRTNFAKKIYDWAEQNGVQITGHFVEETSLQGQMMCCGGVMPLYQYEHIPGIDYLGRALKASDMAQKQLGSVCAQTGRKKALSEMFGCCGWDVTPRELKRIAEYQYASGVNVMCQHLYPYSIRGQRKRDYPAFYSEHNLWQKDLKEFDRYFNHLGALLSMGTEYADTLVIHPMHSAWLTYQRICHDTSVQRLNHDLDELVCTLSDQQIAYHFGDETMMATEAAVNGKTVTVGKCKYKRIIIPACDTLDGTTVALLKKFMGNGGQVYTYKHHLPTRIDGIPADLSFLAACEDISEQAVIHKLRADTEVVITPSEDVGKQELRMMTRSTEYGRLIYIANLSGKEFHGLGVTVKNCSRLGRMDIATLGISPLQGNCANGNAEVSLDLMANEAVVLYEYQAPPFAAVPADPGRSYIRFTEPFAVEKLPANMLTLGRACVSFDGVQFTEPRPLERIRDNLLSSRYKGDLFLSFPFYVKDLPPTLDVVTEPFGSSEITVNGTKIPIGDRPAQLDRSFRVTDISEFVRVGENRIELKMHYWQRDYVYYVLYGGVSETLRNCLVFDTEIENIYLLGEFALDMPKSKFKEYPNNAFRYESDEPMYLVKPKETLDITNLVTDGYPFYCGEVTASTTLNYMPGDPTVLHLTGRYSTAKICVNGQYVTSLVLSEYGELKDALKVGNNTVTITLCNNYRNLLGPHHTQSAELIPVSPRWFSFEKKWKGSCCDEFNPRYSFVRFGIDQ